MVVKLEAHTSTVDRGVRQMDVNKPEILRTTKILHFNNMAIMLETVLNVIWQAERKAHGPLVDCLRLVSVFVKMRPYEGKYFKRYII